MPRRRAAPCSLQLEVHVQQGRPSEVKTNKQINRLLPRMGLHRFEGAAMEPD